jgi:hypothetical protein
MYIVRFPIILSTALRAAGSNRHEYATFGDQRYGTTGAAESRITPRNELANVFTSFYN